MTACGTPPTRRHDGSFFDEVLAGLPRADQRHWARTYMRGLLAAQGRKTVRAVAGSLLGPPTVAQSLQQFVNASPWDWEPVRAALLHWTQRRTPQRCWTLKAVVTPKRGSLSVGVHQHRVPATGRLVGRQLSVGAFASCDRADVPVHWRLLLPGPWGEDPRLRRRARIPRAVHARAVWRVAVDLADSLATPGARAAVPVVADLGLTGAGAGSLVRELSRRRHDFLVAVPSALAVVPAAAPSKTRGGADFETLSAGEALGLGRPPTAAHRAWSMRTAAIRLGDAAHGDDEPPTGRNLLLFAEPGPGGRSPRLWVTNLRRRRGDELLALTGRSTGVEETVRELAALGLLDFEGRSFPGWHHHVTLVSAAYAYQRLAGSGAGLPVPRAVTAALRERSANAHTSHGR